MRRGRRSVPRRPQRRSSVTQGRARARARTRGAVNVSEARTCRPHTARTHPRTHRWARWPSRPPCPRRHSRRRHSRHSSRSHSHRYCYHSSPTRLGWRRAKLRVGVKTRGESKGWDDGLPWDGDEDSGEGGGAAPSSRLLFASRLTPPPLPHRRRLSPGRLPSMPPPPPPRAPPGCVELT